MYEREYEAVMTDYEELLSWFDGESHEFGCHCYADNGEAYVCRRCQTETALRSLIEENKRLREGLKPFVDDFKERLSLFEGIHDGDGDRHALECEVSLSVLRRARAAMEPPK
jgi:hypothetical protein